MYNRVFLCQKSHFRVRTSFGEVFFDRCSWWCKRRWNSLYGHFSRRTRLYTHRPEREQPINTLQSAALHETRLGRMSLKKCVFGCEEKITLFSFPKEPTATWTVDIVCFSGAAMEFLKCVCWQTFINKAQFDAGFAHRLILKDGAVPAVKDPGHDSELPDGKWNSIKCLCFVGDQRKCWSLFSSAHTARLQELRFFRRES